MKKPRKPYSPKYTSSAGGLTVLAKLHIRAENNAPLRVDQTQALATSHWLALADLRTGAGKEESIEFVASALNMAMALAENGIGPEYEEVIVAGQIGCMRALARHKPGTAFRLDGDAMRDIGHALTAHDMQLEVAQRKEVVEAIQLLQRRVAEGNVFSIEPA